MVDETFHVALFDDLLDLLLGLVLVPSGHIDLFDGAVLEMLALLALQDAECGVRALSWFRVSFRVILRGISVVVFVGVEDLAVLEERECEDTSDEDCSNLSEDRCGCRAFDDEAGNGWRSGKRKTSAMTANDTPTVTLLPLSLSLSDASLMILSFVACMSYRRYYHMLLSNATPT